MPGTKKLGSCLWCWFVVKHQPPEKANWDVFMDKPKQNLVFKFKPGAPWVQKETTLKTPQWPKTTKLKSPQLTENHKWDKKHKWLLIMVGRQESENSQQHRRSYSPGNGERQKEWLSPTTAATKSTIFWWLHCLWTPILVKCPAYHQCLPVFKIKTGLNRFFLLPFIFLQKKHFSEQEFYDKKPTIFRIRFFYVDELKFCWFRSGRIFYNLVDVFFHHSQYNKNAGCSPKMIMVLCRKIHLPKHDFSSTCFLTLIFYFGGKKTPKNMGSGRGTVCLIFCKKLLFQKSAYPHPKPKLHGPKWRIIGGGIMGEQFTREKWPNFF